MSDAPSVTVLIPARNEEADIERCLRAVLAQDHPHDRMEIVLVDGGSTDRTAEIASAVLSEGGFDWKIIDNPTGTTPSNLNAGLAVAAGEILCRVDARSIVPPEYVRLCAEVLSSRPDVVVTGGAQVAVAQDDTTLAIGIARALNNRYAMGGSRYRSGAASGPADTVYLGAFRTEELRAVTGWDPKMLTNQDYDLNRRLARRGVVLYDHRLRVGYVPRRTLRGLATQYHRFGRWKVRYWRIAREPPRPRQVLLLAVPVAGVCVFAGVAPRLAGRPHLAAAAISGLALLALGVEASGCVGPDGPIASRVRSVMAMALVSGSWLSGVATELLLSDPGWSGPDRAGDDGVAADRGTLGAC